ncbi:hypothetical protein COCVIDRAFT_97202 [Bipolaris victoriae FI3]|uniref:Uncharacterized protein n=1 Tax=Bipolaris victoriae (strain FI3) TaxID=930091 RepID=W7EIC1_BIPV3|nr:hypothetical protein COCVIDRAFT_97202 [Bipolaris victoriae FI3]
MDEDSSSLHNNIAAPTASLNTVDGSFDMTPPTEKPIKNIHHDSFFELARLMKEKKPYTATPNLTPRLSPPARPNNRSFSRSTKSFTAPETVAEFLEKQENQSTTSSSSDLAYPSDIEPLPRVVSVESPTSNESLQTPRLEEHIPMLGRHTLAPEQSDEEIQRMEDDGGSQLCRLKYQNEVNKDQKASMCRLLAEKEMRIKTQQLDFDRLARRMTELEAELKDLEEAARERDFLRSTVAKLARERDEALQAATCAQDYQTRIQKLTDHLVRFKEANLELRQKLVEEGLNKINLGEDNEDLQAKLREKTSLCDRQRDQLKTVERELRISEERLNNTQSGQLLQGAAHLVRPHMHAELPKRVVACSECYANNLECDSEARCRSCTERDVSCGRWRCSMKHKLGDCPLALCKLSHDSQGWLILPKERPQW